jgi:hypothetical protein
MRIDNLKHWHWCIIGIIVGLTIGFIKLSSGAPEPKGLEVVGPHAFESQVIFEQDLETRQRVINVRNIRLHPPQEINIPGEREPVPTEFITYDIDRTLKSDPKKMETFPRQMILQIKPARKQPSRAGDLAGLTMRQYLDKINEVIDKEKARFPKLTNITYKYNWWEAPKAMYTICGTAGFVVIGLIWPTIIQMLVHAGYGRGKREDDEYLSRFKGGAEPGKVGKAGITEDDMSQFAKLEAELEASLKAGATDQPMPATKSTPASAPIPVLTAGPMAGPKVEEKKVAAPKGYGADQGDYYPTEVHGKKNS